MDNQTRERRSENMRRIRSKGTTPELKIRRLVHSLGYRFRLHGKKLPGKPDLVFASRRKLILVHGCFWHQHKDLTCKIARQPKSNTDYWGAKLQRNVDRDLKNRETLTQEGWRILTIWECQLVNEADLIRKITDFLD